MARKKGSKKPVDDDVWADNDDVQDPIKAALSNQSNDLDDGAGDAEGGGLMGIISNARSKKSKKKDKSSMIDSFSKLDIDEDLPSKKKSGKKAPEFEADFSDEGSDLEPKMASKKNKKKKAPTVTYADELDSIPELLPKDKKKLNVDLEEIEGTQIKSSKQKEKERKERLKLEKKKKEQENKSKQPPKSAPTPADPEKQTGSKKKSKQPESMPSKGKGGPNVAALQKMIEAQRAAELEAKRQMEEMLRLEQEELKRIEEEERKAEEARLAKKEKERLKKEQLRKEGKLLTKKEKEAKRKQEAFLQQLKDSGAQIPGLLQANQPDNSSDKKKKRVVYGDRKKKPQKSESELSQDQAVNKEPDTISSPPIPTNVEPEVKEEEENQDESEDNWEALLESSESEEEKDNKKSIEDDKQDEKKQAVKANASSSKQKTKPANSESESSSEDDSDDDSDDSSDSSDSSSDGEGRISAQRKREAQSRREKRMKAAMDARSSDNLRSPICCILGHVDTGKTKLLDRIRQTDVQGGEAGGITQQIGATYFPASAIIKKTAVINKSGKLDIKVPGLLIIDTPGHESFTNLRSRGSSLCNIAILVVDIMHGLEPQTLESLRLLREKKTPFVVALNKIDRIYNWKSTDDNGFRLSFNQQSESVKREFNNRLQSTIVAFAEQGLNSKLYYENKNFAKNVSLVPTSAVTGEGVPDLLALLVSLTQTRMESQLMYLSELEATVLEVKVIEGLGTTIDVVLSNGVLNEGDRIVLCGLDGPIATNIRALLTPQPMRELRLKSQYIHHKTIKAAMGVKISAPGLEKSIAGSRLMVVGPDDDEEEIMDEVMSDLISLQDNIDKSGKGVWVQSSTLGSLEALLEFLRTSKIPVSGLNIGPVHRKDVFRASAMIDKAKEFAVMLCFDVKVDKDASDYAEEIGIKIFTADIIYHLFDSFTAHIKELTEQKRKDQSPQAVFPCVLKMIPGAAFNKRDPIVIGVDVVEGQLRLGTPICVVNINPETKAREVITLGKVTSMEINHKPMTVVKRGEAGAGVAIKIECPSYETPKLFGRHFDEKSELFSKITRSSINILKDSFRNDMSKDDWALIIKLKKILDVQ
ncbi:Eukaryotic translation initiation factor 5B [Smittium mucronatum]|uniref:Eukaryotic translation initiation factor 5B n=1 Tax=Smittium mucronatum TaxID=133383 RepID=A0A1R0GWP3_9FUNG|nr:Eukaryotic translation initiation factor 5B [Smittium mucronatum]